MRIWKKKVDLSLIDKGARMNGIVEFVVVNQDMLSYVAAGVLALATIIAAKTATKKDDKIVGWLQKGLGMIGLAKKVVNTSKNEKKKK